MFSWRFKEESITGTVGSQIGRPCLTILGPPNPVLLSVQQLAAGDLDDSVLTLYPVENFDGEQLVIEEQGASKIENGSFTARSWALTGAQNFTVFDAENFAGNAICLEVADKPRYDGFGVTAKASTDFELEVRSAKVGCDGTEIRRLKGASQNLHEMQMENKLKEN